jgi:hypothetical protein
MSPPSSEELSSPRRPFERLNEDAATGVLLSAKMEVAPRLGDEASDKRVSEKCADLVLDRRETVRAIAVRQSIEFLLEEGAYRWVVCGHRNRAPESLV